MSDVLLLQPPGACRAFTRSGSSYPPLGLCQLVAMASDLATVLDADGLGWSDEQALSALSTDPPRVIGLTATTYTLELVERWASAAREVGAVVVVGGPHATLEPVDLLRRCPSVDVAVGGAAEGVFRELCERLVARDSVAELPGVMDRSGPITDDILRIEDFASLPFPRFDDLPIDAYACPDARRSPMVTFMTARGCPHTCGFCSSPVLLGRKVRGWPVSAVVDELARLVRDHGVREISFVDDVFTVNRARAIALCEGMVERGLDLTWFCNARADQVTPELAMAMAAAGCHQVYLGFESGSQQILDHVTKGTTVARLERGAQILADAGIGRSVGFVLGLPGETDNTIAVSIALAHRVKPERLQFTRWTSLPGTPLALERGVYHRGFHDTEDDEVGRWVARAYAACAGQRWGARSW